MPNTLKEEFKQSTVSEVKVYDLDIAQYQKAMKEYRKHIKRLKRLSFVI